MAVLREEEAALREASKLPEKVVSSLDKLDRKTLAEIARMSSPPKAVKASLEIVYIFLEVFPEHKVEAAVEAVTSPVKKDKGEHLPRAEWPEIRKLLAVDLRPRIIALTPELVRCRTDDLTPGALHAKTCFGRSFIRICACACLVVWLCVVMCGCVCVCVCACACAWVRVVDTRVDVWVRVRRWRGR